MADGIEEAQAKLNEYIKSLNLAPEIMEKVSRYLNNEFSQSMRTAANAMGTTAQAAKQMAQDLTGTLSGAVNKAAQALEQFDDNMGEIRTSTGSASTQFDKLTKAYGALTNLTTRGDPFQTFNRNSSINTASDSLEKLLNSANGFGPVAAKAEAALKKMVPTVIWEKGKEAVKNFLSNAANTQKLESSFMNLQGSVGGLNKFFEANGQLNDKLSDSTALFSRRLSETHFITGQTTEVIGDLASKLLQIPGAMDGINKTNNLDQLTSALTMASGAGVGVEKVVNAMETAYENLGNAQGKVTDGAKKGSDLFALMSTTANTLNLKFSDTEGFLTGVAKAFGKIGDNTAAAANILGRFSGALQATGLTGKQSLDVVNNMVGALGKMHIGTQALLSQRNGGPGGLQGAFQIQNMLRNGKGDDVMRMAERSLRQQFGGKIYTQEEAGQSQQAASQFYRQRSFLRSGAFGELAQNDDDASRLLEALGKGNLGAANIKTGDQAVKEVSDRGRSIQLRNNNLLEQLIASNEGLIAANNREAFNTASELNVENSDDARNRVSESEEILRQNANAAMDVNKIPKASDTQRLGRRRDWGNAYATTKELGVHGAGVVKEVASNIPETVKASWQIATDAVKNAKNKNPPPTNAGQPKTAAQVTSEQNKQNQNEQVVTVKVAVTAEEGLVAAADVDASPGTIVQAMNSASTNGGLPQ